MCRSDWIGESNCVITLTFKHNNIIEFIYSFRAPFTQGLFSMFECCHFPHDIFFLNFLQFPEFGYPVCEEERSERGHHTEDHQRNQPLQWWVLWIFMRWLYNYIKGQCYLCLRKRNMFLDKNGKKNWIKKIGRYAIFTYLHIYYWNPNVY